MRQADDSRTFSEEISLALSARDRREGVSIPLDRAYLCLDCDSIHVGGVCPECASKACHPLANWLESLEGAYLDGTARS